MVVHYAVGAASLDRKLVLDRVSFSRELDGISESATRLSVPGSDFGPAGSMA